MWTTVLITSVVFAAVAARGRQTNSDVFAWFALGLTNAQARAVKLVPGEAGPVVPYLRSGLAFVAVGLALQSMGHPVGSVLWALGLVLMLIRGTTMLVESTGQLYLRALNGVALESRAAIQPTGDDRLDGVASVSGDVLVFLAATTSADRDALATLVEAGASMHNGLLELPLPESAEPAEIDVYVRALAHLDGAFANRASPTFALALRKLRTQEDNAVRSRLLGLMAVARAPHALTEAERVLRNTELPVDPDKLVARQPRGRFVRLVGAVFLAHRGQPRHLETLREWVDADDVRHALEEVLRQRFEGAAGGGLALAEEPAAGGITVSEHRQGQLSIREGERRADVSR